MKQKFLTLALIAASIFSAAPVLDAQNINNGRQECVRNGKVCNIKADNTSMRAICIDNDECYRRPGSDRSCSLMKGITLTPEQKKKVEAYEEKMRKQYKKQREKARDDRKKYAEKSDKEIKKILTPEQYRQYEANKAALKHRGHKDNFRNCDKRHKHATGMRKGKKGNCCRPAKSPACCDRTSYAAPGK